MPLRRCTSRTALVLHQEQRRLSQWFSTNNNAKQKPPRRKRKISLRPTTKDRIRRRQQRPSSGPLQADLLAERMSKRLEWFRSQIVPEESTSVRRPKRYEVVMDLNWWFWNILFALSPAALVVLYCEFVVKPKMKREYEGFLVQEQKDGTMIKKTAITEKNGTSTSTSDQQWQQIQDLKVKLLALEDQMQHDNSTKQRRATAGPLKSNMQRRREEQMAASSAKSELENDTSWKSTLQKLLVFGASSSAWLEQYFRPSPPKDEA